MKSIFKKFVFLIGMFLIGCFQSVGALNIVLDPGHGGKDSGCVYKYDGKVVKEKTLNYKIASFIKEQLSKYKTNDGKEVNVYLTLSNPDDRLTLKERIEIGVIHSADMLISLHVNASYNGLKKDSGSMVLVTNSSFNGKYDIEKTMAKNILEELHKVGLNISNDNLGGQSRNDNGLLYRLSDDGSVYPNGETTDWYGIIRIGILKNIPSILVEHAYLDNESDYRNFLSTDDKLRILANAVSKGIIRYYGLVLKNK